MLAADKLQLQSALKQQATALKEKEFNLHHSNLMTVGTQAAVLAGLDITMFIEFQPPADHEWPVDLQHVAGWLRVAYYGIIVAAFCANMIVVSHTTALSVLGAGLALRGPDGSMMTATDGLYEERQAVFLTYGIGLACTVGSVLVGVWLLLPWPGATVCWMVTMFTCKTIYVNYKRVVGRFEYDESETVDFRDIMEGPASLTVSQRGGKGGYKQLLAKSNNKKPVYRKSASTTTDASPSHEWDLEMQDAKSNSTREHDGGEVKRRKGTSAMLMV